VPTVTVEAAGETASASWDDAQPAFSNTWFADVAPAAGPKKVLAHLVPWDSIILDNRAMNADYYARAFLTVNGESGKHASYGGYFRDAPYHNAPYPGGGSADSPSAAARRAAENDNIKHAVYSGLDGFFVDIVANSTTHAHWPKLIATFDEASANFPGFLVVPMIDLNGAIADLSVSQIASLINILLSKSCAWRMADGRYVVGAFKAEAKDNAWWASLESAFNALGKQVYFVGAFNNMGPGYNPNLPVFDAVGQWSPGADPMNVSSFYPGGYNEAISRGQTPLVAVLPQGVRFYSSWYDESRGLAALQASWDRVIRVGATLVQVVTWNDFAEGSQSMATRKQGTAVGAYQRYRIIEWKNGQRPQTVRDSVILSHRNQTLNASYPSGQIPIEQRDRGGVETASLDEVEVRTFLTASQQVTVNAGSVQTVYTAPAGEYVRYVSTTAGQVRVRVGAIDYTSPVTIRSSSGNQDREWVHAWVHDEITVFDPTPAS
jgi:hypothetical protein